MKIYVLRSTEDVRAVRAYFARSHCVRTAAVPPRLKMTEFREVEKRRQTENYTHTANFIPQQKNKVKVSSLKRSPSVISQVAQPPCAAISFLSDILYSKSWSCPGKSKSFLFPFRKKQTPLLFHFLAVMNALTVYMPNPPKSLNDRYLKVA